MDGWMDGWIYLGYSNVVFIRPCGCGFPTGRSAFDADEMEIVLKKVSEIVLDGELWTIL
jgi:hypothetical protein